jgi:hypothetical protein
MTPSRGAPAAVAHSCDIFRDGPLHSTRRVEGAPGGEHRETRAMSDDDLDRFNDSDSEPERAVAGTSAGKAKGVANANGNSSPAAASPGGGGKAAQRRAKKTAAKRARLERRRQERTVPAGQGRRRRLGR